MSRPFDPGPLLAAELALDDSTSKKGYRLKVSREFAAEPEQVWLLLTDPDHLVQWAPFRPGHNLSKVGPVKFVMEDSHSVEEFEAEVKQADPPRALTFTWGGDLLEWTVEPSLAGSKLTLHHTVAEEHWIPKVAAGWQICLAVADRLLRGDPVGPIVGMAALDHGWQELHDQYAKALGVEPTPLPEGTFDKDS